MSEDIYHYTPKRNQRAAGIEFLDWEDRTEVPASWLEIAANLASIIAVAASCFLLAYWIIAVRG